MQEDLKQNFILLSKVAKVKRYAQEYLGLLARRGDLGSIRIGKRWYTTEDWFAEFLKNSEKKSSFARAMADKKNEAAAEVIMKKIVEEKVPVMQVAAPREELLNENIQITHPVAVVEPSFAKASEGEGKKIFVAPTAVPLAVNMEKKKVSAQQTVVREVVSAISLSVRRPVPVRTGFQMRAPKRTDIRRAPIQEARTGRKRFVPERNDEFFVNQSRVAAPFREIKLRDNQALFSPDFRPTETFEKNLFPRFAFAAGFAIMTLLIAASAYFVYTGGLLKVGRVAGASDERIGDFSGIKTITGTYLASAGSKIKESVSISRLAVQAVRQKTASNAQ